MRSLEGANCADLPGFVVDKYFNCHVQQEPLLAMAAKAICSNCVVQEECLSEALSMPNLPRGGVIAGLPVNEVRAARSWRRYEQGGLDRVPRARRPQWLAMTDATQDQERLRLADDPDEPEVFIADRPEERVGRAVACRPIPAATTAAPEAKSIGKRKPKQGPRMQYSSVDVPVPLRGANCAAMPPELVEKYFNADVLRQAAASQVAKVVCAHCPIIETCFNRALNGGTVRRSGVIAGMGARELQRGRLWLRYERGTARRVPSSQRPEWLPQNDASGRFQQPETATTDTQS